jgi:2-hydroxy-3-oxopropionate reductase
VSERVGVIGLGVMGLPMTLNLIAAGHAVTVASRSPAPVERAVAAGAIRAVSARAVSEAADVVITVLPDTPDVELVAGGADGLLGGLREGAVWIDMSTISPIVTRALAQEAHARGARFLDAPVSGGQAAAEAGTLAIMVGGEADTLERVRPVLAVLGKVTHIGACGAGQIAKAANQMVVAGTIALVAEALTFAESLDVDPGTVREALLGGFAQSRILEVHGQRMLDGAFTPGFRVDLQHKDLSIALDAGSATRTPLPVAAQVRELFNALRAHGGGDLDHAALALLYARLSGRTLSPAPRGQRDGANLVAVDPSTSAR